MALPLFCYGTLELAPVMRAVAGRLPQQVAATLVGYRRRLVEGRHYPGIAPSNVNERVNGTLYQALRTQELLRIDRFEGNEYARRPVTVTTRAGKARAWAYLIDARRARLGTACWDREAFVRQHLRRYLRGLTRAR